MWYTNTEAMRIVVADNPDLDLDLEHDFKTYEAVRQELIKNL